MAEKVNYMEVLKAERTIAQAKDWNHWYSKMPSISFDSDMQIQIVPPYGGALVRFVAKKGKNRVSVYFDVDDSLGVMEKPYWEIYPAADGDTQRFLVGQEREMVAAIRDSLNASDQAAPVPTEYHSS